MDIQKALESLGGESNIYYNMLSKFEPMSLAPSIVEMAQAVNQLDFLKLKLKAHGLKASSAYVGAGHIHYCCYHMQDEYMQENFQKMLEYYPTLIEHVVYFKLYSRKIMAEKKSKGRPLIICL